MHDFDDANKKLIQSTKWGRRMHLENNANVLHMNFITNPFMDLLYDKEKRISGEGEIEYCMIKPSVLNNLFENREFTRRAKKDCDGKIVTPGTRVMSESFYGFTYQDYRWFEGTSKDGKFVRAILDPEKDRDFIDYLNEREEVTEYFWF